MWSAGPRSRLQVRFRFRVSLLQPSLRRSEPHRNQLRHARFLHGYAVKHGRNAHGLLAVRDEDELRLDTHVFYEVGEAADVGLVEWRVHFVKYAERAGRVLEDADQQGKSGECLLASREQ